MNEKSIFPLQFITGLIFALGASTLMYFGVFPIYLRVVIGIIGLILIATSKYRLL